MADETRRDGTVWRDSLSFRLFGLTVSVILLTELLIFIPSAKGFRDSWIDARVETSRVVAITLDAAPSQQVTKDLSDELFDAQNIVAVAEIGGGIRQSLLPPRYAIDGDHVLSIDTRTESFLEGLFSTIGTSFSSGERSLRVLAESGRDNQFLEIIIAEAPLRDALSGFSLRIIALSLVISGVAGVLVYIGLFFLVVRPVQFVTRSLEQFAVDPGAWTQRTQPTTGRDEISRAVNALGDMETVVSQAFRERERLAQLGEAVAKINHDLRNSLAAAQLVSDGLSQSEDPRVQRAVPRLERVLERAIKLTQDTLQFGKAKPPEPSIQSVALHEAIEEAAREGLAAGNGTLAWRNDIPDTMQCQADPDHLHRITANLVRNAAQALSTRSDEAEICARYDAGSVFITDNGPGLPEKARDGLFKAFAGSSKRDGSGLGLAIARELARGMGGDLTLAHTGASGTAFQIILPHHRTPAA